MARLIPNQVLPGRPVAFSRVFRLCKSLPDTYTVWQRVGRAGINELLVFFEEKRMLQLTVSDISPQELRDYVQRELFGDEAHPFEQRRAALASANPLSILAFPLLRQAGIDRLELDDWETLNREDLRPEMFEAAVQERLSDELNDTEVADVRRRFCPEVVIPNSLSVRPLIDRNVKAGLSNLLLDLDQETILKTDLHLDPDSESIASALNVRLVTGVAGSGKSLLVLYRLRLLRSLLGKDKRMLVLTHNRALIRDLESRYLILSSGDREVEFKTFLAWCHDNWPDGFPAQGPISNAGRMQIARECVRDKLADTVIKPERLLEEIDWCKDSFSTRQEYMTADRAGRGFRLTDSMRERVYAAILQYQEALEKTGRIDWGDVPRRLWQRVQSGDAVLPEYDAVFVDEAQFFAPYWFTLLKQSLKPRHGHLFIVADPTQGFLKRRQSWAALGIEVRGRSQRLERSYRTTQSIMTFANLLYRDRSPDDAEAILAPDLSGMPPGVMPTVIPLSSPQDEQSRAVNEIKDMIERGTRPENLLVIHADASGVKPLINRLNQEFGKDTAADPRHSRDRKLVRVCSLDASTGLESAVVFLLGIHKLYEKEQSLYLTEEERTALIRTNTRKLYMAITRTGQRLVITYVGVLPKVFDGLS